MSFATVVNCMDGRTQGPVISYLKERFGVDYVDDITEAGPDGLLARFDDPAAVEAICRKIRISQEKHGSKWLAIVGHVDCDGNPVSSEEHHRQIRAAVEFLRRKFPTMTVIGLWLGEDWIVQEIAGEEDG